MSDASVRPAETGLVLRDAPARSGTGRPGLLQRLRLRRRVRFLRKQRELQLRDLGGLIFDMYRFGSKRQDLVREKLRLMFEADRELRAFEAALGGRRPTLDVREQGVAGSCPRCLTLYSTEAHFCWRCGLALTEQAETSGLADVDLDAAAAEPAEHPPAAEDEEAVPAGAGNGAAPGEAAGADAGTPGSDVPTDEQLLEEFGPRQRITSPPAGASRPSGASRS